MCHFQYIHVQEGRNVSSIPIKVNVEGGESIDIVCVPEVGQIYKTKYKRELSFKTFLFLFFAVFKE